VRDLLRRRMLLVQLRTSLILSFKSLNERTLGQRVPLARVKALSIEEAQGRFTAPADQLLGGEQIGLMGQLQESINKIEKHILAATKEWKTFQRVQDVPGIGKILTQNRGTPPIGTRALFCITNSDPEASLVQML
jgi:transposase